MSVFLLGGCKFAARKKNRRGATAVQVAVVVGLVTLAAIAGITQVGTASNTRMTATASAVGNPANLVSGFGNSGSSQSSGSGSSSGSESGSGSSGSSSSGSSGSSSGGSSGSSGSICP